MNSNYMEAVASSSEFMANIGMCFLASVILFVILDTFASKKLGGRRMLGYKVLRIPRFFSLVFTSAYSIVMMVLANYKIFEPTYSMLTYIQLPYFVVWVYFLVTVLRRIRAETKGSPWRGRGK